MSINEQSHYVCLYTDPRDGERLAPGHYEQVFMVMYISPSGNGGMTTYSSHGTLDKARQAAESFASRHGVPVDTAA